MSGLDDKLKETLGIVQDRKKAEAQEKRIKELEENTIQKDKYEKNLKEISKLKRENEKYESIQKRNRERIFKEFWNYTSNLFKKTAKVTLISSLIVGGSYFSYSKIGQYVEYRKDKQITLAKEDLFNARKLFDNGKYLQADDITEKLKEDLRGETDPELSRIRNDNEEFDKEVDVKVKEFKLAHEKRKVSNDLESIVANTRSDRYKEAYNIAKKYDGKSNSDEEISALIKSINSCLGISFLYCGKNPGI